MCLIITFIVYSHSPRLWWQPNISACTASAKTWKTRKFATSKYEINFPYLLSGSLEIYWQTFFTLSGYLKILLRDGDARYALENKNDWLASTNASQMRLTDFSSINLVDNKNVASRFRAETVNSAFMQKHTNLQLPLFFCWLSLDSTSMPKKACQQFAKAN